MFDVLLGASGGIFGIVGALAKHGLEIWQAKSKASADLLLLQEQNRHELLMADKRAEEIRLEAEHAVRLGEIARQKETDVAAWTALGASYDQDKATYSSGVKSRMLVMVDVVRGLVRPVLTAIFSLALILATFWLLRAVPDALSGDAAFLTGTLYRMVDALLFLATSSVGWWFAARYTGGK